MKRPRLDEYPMTDERTFINIDCKEIGNRYLWNKYAIALEKYIDYLENKLKERKKK